MCNMLCSPIHGAIEVPEIYLYTLQTLFFTLAVSEWGAVLCMSISYIYCLEGAPCTYVVLLFHCILSYTILNI
jgi:hypothetical protein